jgi:hypothetical protein
MNKMTDTTPNHYPSIAQSFGASGIVILGMLLLSPVMITLNNLIDKEPSMLIYYLLAIGIPCWIVFQIRKSKTGDASFSLKIENKRIVPWIILGTIALLWGVISPIASTIPMSDETKKAFMDFAGEPGVYSFVLLVIAAPVLEEILFRGIILDGLLKRYSPLKSILVSSFLFGIVHLNPWQFVAGFVIGIFAGWVYYQTHSLLASIIIHASANLHGFLARIFMDADAAMNDSLVETYGGTGQLILAIVGSLVVIAICIYYLDKEFKKRKIKVVIDQT